jgi:glycosyltransferase involved in cell wall biosynthesis
LNYRDIVAEKRTRIAVINSHPIQYFAPLYAYLNATPDLDVTALYLSDLSIRGGKDEGFNMEFEWDIDLLSGYRSVFVGSRARKRKPRGFFSLIAPQIWTELRSGRYDILWLHGHNYAANLIALLAAKSVGMQIMMRGETHLGLPCRAIKSVLRPRLMGALYRACDRLLAIGSANAQYYRAMGVAQNKIFLVPYSVDNMRFTRFSNLSCERRAEIRRRHNIPVDRVAVLYSAKFIERKRPLDLLKAVLRLKQEGIDRLAVVMVGSGELENDLREFSRQHELDVIFTGFVNQTKLPEIYAASDIFVLPSQDEPWGLAVNEAMCAGLPVVVSREVGCVADLVHDGVNGCTPAAGDITALAAALGRLVCDEDLRRQQGQQSLSRIQQWSYRECLDGIRLALADLETGTVHRPRGLGM